MADRSLSPEEAAFLRLGRAYQATVAAVKADPEAWREGPAAQCARRRLEAAGEALFAAARALPGRSEE